MYCTNSKEIQKKREEAKANKRHFNDALQKSNADEVISQENESQYQQEMHDQAIEVFTPSKSVRAKTTCPAKVLTEEEHQVQKALIIYCQQTLFLTRGIDIIYLLQTNTYRM